MKKVLPLFIFISLAGSLKSQCLQIEGILADACNSGLSEPYNEMVRFKTGSTAIPITQLSIMGRGNTGTWTANKWPNLAQLWHGLVQNANTASKVSSINASILACGYVKEPPAGVIPPNVEVIMVTSQYMNPTSNSFANLNDTIYMVFQDTVNNAVAGHFANWNAVPGNRSLALVDNVTGCIDSATYDISLLPLHTNGDGIEYDVAGNPTYINNGCQAPYIPLFVDAGPDQTICQQDTFAINATGSGNISSVVWSGGLGNFSSPNSIITNYIPASNETGTVQLIVSISTACGNNVKDTVLLNITAFPIAFVNTSSSVICQGQSTTLTASGGLSYSWQPGGSTGSTLNVTTQGTYTLSAINGCANDTATIYVQVNPLPLVSVSANGATTFCAGGTVDIVSTGATTYTWSNAQTNDTINVASSGFYWVNGTNSCGTDSAGINITVIPTPTVSASASTNNFCVGDSVLLSASTQGGNTITWFPQNIISNSVYVLIAGTYTVTSQSACGTDIDSVTVNTQSPLSISIATNSNDTICQGNSTTLTASGGSSYTWSTSASTDSIPASAQRNYFVYS